MSYFKTNPESRKINELKERIEKLEEKVFKTARKDSTSLREQILLMHHLGLLDRLNEFNMSNFKKAKLLSVLLNGSFDNIRDHLTQVHKKGSELKTKKSYTLVHKTFAEVGLKALAEQADIILEEIEKSEK